MNTTNIAPGFGSFREAAELLNQAKEAIITAPNLSTTVKLLQIAGINKAFDLIASNAFEQQIRYEADKEVHEAHFWDGVGQGDDIGQESI